MQMLLFYPVLALDACFHAGTDTPNALFPFGINTPDATFWTAIVKNLEKKSRQDHHM